MRGIEELRVKESDRITAMCQGLQAIGAIVTEEHDGVIVEHSQLTGQATIKTMMDHRIAMSFLIAGTVAQNPIAIDNGSFIETSFPNFIPLMNKIGCQIIINDLKNKYDK
jgi:3-phosphoshikimate 1-carboxyvinyltransferase